jgi:hypothetical protein
LNKTNYSENKKKLLILDGWSKIFPKLAVISGENACGACKISEKDV